MIDWATPSALEWLQDLLYERFGSRFRLKRIAADTIQLNRDGDPSAIDFHGDQTIFTSDSSSMPCARWDAAAEGWFAPIFEVLPVPGADCLSLPLVRKTQRGFDVHYDIPGLVYWMLSRWEEVGATNVDAHGRFPATESHAFKHGYLERPIVDEWLCILAQLIARTWPTLSLKQHQFSVRVSHDVDSPSPYAFKSWPVIARVMAGHVVKRRDPKAFFLTPYLRLATRRSLRSLDPYNTFDWLMDLAESFGRSDAFYFICGRTEPAMDSDYEPEHPAIRDLMRRIHSRGHEIGLHPSYGTYRAPALLKQEADRLRKICAEEGIDQTAWGGRMHYLRWEQPTTLQAWQDAGLAYDSTMSYADRPGFRCGTSFEYPAFNPITQQCLSLRIRPLILMECSLIDDVYLGLGTGAAAREKIGALRSACRKVGGTFTVLWHNSYLGSPSLRELYCDCIGG